MCPNMQRQIKLSLPFFFVTFLYATYVFLSQTDKFSISFLKRTDKGTAEINNARGTIQQDVHYALFTEGCKVPKFDPFDPSVSKYYESVGEDIVCKGEKYLTVKNNVVVLDRARVQEDFSAPDDFKCTYKPIYRNPENITPGADRHFGYGLERVLNAGEALPAEFVKVICRVRGKVEYVEFLASTPIKPSVEERCLRDSAKVSTPDVPNIVIVGIDSISKLNFERHFKKTARYLRQNLSMFEFHGYMKVADNTFPNLTPLLTGHFISRYFNKSNHWRYFDDLDFVWKDFSSVGYRTLFAEDAPDMGTYNYVKNGFQYPPTDYFFRPFTLAIEDSPWQKASKVDCFQANPEILVLFNYLRSFLETMGNRRYFAFTWAARLTHSVLNKAGYADKPSFELLKYFNDMGHFNRSVVLFLSDHGIRFGGIRKTFVGKIEERMPYLFVSFPPWFLDANPAIKTNLILNQNRLTTPFDIHETLVDLYQMVSGDESYVRTPYGISLFREIPKERNCQSAYILPHWCVCHEYQKLKSSDQAALEAAEALVTAVNDATAPYRNVCTELKLSAVLDARVSKPEEDLLKYNELVSGDDESSITFGEKSNSFEKFLITVKTDPGDEEFEGSIRKIETYYKTYDISRINAYGNTADCIDDFELRKYCYCKKSS